MKLCFPSPTGTYGDNTAKRDDRQSIDNRCLAHEGKICYDLAILQTGKERMMANYLDFRTATEHGDSLVFTDEVPSTQGGLQVRADGVPLEFVDGTIPDRLAEVIAIGRERQTRRLGGLMFDGYDFAASMHGMPLDTAAVVDFSIDDEAQVTDADLPDTDVVIGRGYHEIPIVGDHIIVPSHIVLEGLPTPQYLHKLGINGPVCISGLVKAMELLNADKAYPVTRKAR